jgi:SAM-dependent methyltransferase
MKNQETPYNPESYWSEVGARIKGRVGKNVIAGDDEPYYRYKRQEFLKLLHSVDFKGRIVLEVGSGPGGNLLEVYKHQPAQLNGADISATMVELAKEKVPSEVRITKVDGKKLPFDDQSMDLVFTATVLQHNTDDAMLRQVIGEICRVSKHQVVLFERIEDQIMGDDLCLGRPVSYYADILKAHGFALKSADYINIRASYYFSGAVRKLLNPKQRQEGEPLNGVSVLLQNLSLPVTKVLDKIFTSRKDVAKLVFERVAA